MYRIILHKIKHESPEHVRTKLALFVTEPVILTFITYTAHENYNDRINVAIFPSLEWIVVMHI